MAFGLRALEFPLVSIHYCRVGNAWVPLTQSISRVHPMSFTNWAQYFVSQLAHKYSNTRRMFEQLTQSITFTYRFMSLSMCMSPAYISMHVHSCSTISISMFMLRGSCVRCWSPRVGSRVCVHALVYVSRGISLCVVGGFEEDRASRLLGEISDGWSNCVPSCPLSHHGECVGHGTSNIEIRVVLSPRVLPTCVFS